MINWLKTGLLVCTLASMVAVTVVALSILSQIAIDHTTRYVESYENIAKVENFLEAERHTNRLLSVTEEAIREKRNVEKELAALKRVTKDLYERLNNKETAISEYSQSTHELSRTNEILVRKLRNISFLFQSVIKQLTKEERLEAQKRYLDVISDGGRYE